MGALLGFVGRGEGMLPKWKRREDREDELAMRWNLARGRKGGNGYWC